MSDKIIKREYFKLFSGKDTDIPILKWGLNATIGLHDGGLCNISNLKVQEHKGLYLPPKDYYSCDQLPKEWIDVIKERKDADVIKNRSIES